MTPAGLWDALLNGEVTVVECYDRDGQRFVVARKNKTRVRLSEVERTVVTWVATGGAQKIVALELGLSASGVSDALARALEKLGVSSVAELTRVAAALTARTEAQAQTT
jgi:DNA-binding CsgD family transcriptional regulator